MEKTPGDPNDRIAIEQLGRAAAARVLGTTQEAGVKRSFRALKRPKDVLATKTGGWEGP